VALKLITKIEQCGASPTLDTRLARRARLDHEVIRLIGADHFPHPTRGSSGERLHGPFVSDEEVERVASFLKTRGIPDYIDQITEDDDAPLDPLSGDQPAPLILAGRVGGATGEKGPRHLLGWKRKPAREALLTCFALVSLRRALQNDVLLRHASAWAVIKSDIPEIHRNHHIGFLGLCGRPQTREFSTRAVEVVGAKDPEGSR
jgi:DNA segregation ATPase FtsK/SpoIIIE-like protein